MLAGEVLSTESEKKRNLKSKPKLRKVKVVVCLMATTRARISHVKTIPYSSSVSHGNHSLSGVLPKNTKCCFINWKSKDGQNSKSQVKPVASLEPAISASFKGNFDGPPLGAVIKVVGVGGGGSNAVNRMVEVRECYSYLYQAYDQFHYQINVSAAWWKCLRFGVFHCEHRPPSSGHVARS